MANTRKEAKLGKGRSNQQKKGITAEIFLKRWGGKYLKLSDFGFKYTERRKNVKD